MFKKENLFLFLFFIKRGEGIVLEIFKLLKYY